MSRTIRNHVGSNLPRRLRGRDGMKSHADWWGKRPFSGVAISGNRGMKPWKRLLHKAERRAWRAGE